MLDERPTAAELIAAIAEFIEKEVAPQLDGHTAFHVKVALNGLRIVERELERHGGGADGIARSNSELCARIADGRVAIDDPALLEHLLENVLDRIAVDNPKYPSLNALPGL